MSNIINGIECPFFFKGYENGNLKLNINNDMDYGVACNCGKAGLYDFIKCMPTESDGGSLQSVVLALAGMDINNEAVRGFIVGIFSTLEELLRGHYANDEVRGRIEANNLNNPLTSPLNFNRGASYE